MNETVLVLNDSLTVRMDLVEALEAAGFHPLPCTTVVEARAALAREPVAAVIFDALLPDGDGAALVGELRAAGATHSAGIVMLSTGAVVADRIGGLTTGADEYVGQPYETSEVVARVRELLRARSTSAAGRTTVLVIDDSASYRDKVSVALEAAGYDVVAAASGEEGLLVAARERPAAAIVDGVLPGIDGANVIRRLRLDTATRSMPCLLLSASEGRDAELRALDAGADAFVRKEADLSGMLARLGAILRAAGPQQATLGSIRLLGPKKILAVDDSATYLHELADALQGEGFEVTLAHSGEEALDLLAVQSVDCILLDRLMPGMGGRETCRRIKAAPVVRDVPLIMLSALEDREAMIEGLAAGADDYISKSGDFDVLRARVRAQLRRKQFEDETRHSREDLLHKRIEATKAEAARDLAETTAGLLDELQRKNEELEAFSYSVAHDLRAPLRGIDGFSEALLQDCGDSLDPQARHYITRLRSSATRMRELIDDLLALSHVGRADLRRGPVNIGEIAGQVLADLRRTEPERLVVEQIDEGLTTEADSHLIRLVLENLLGNAWKFTSKLERAEIHVGCAPSKHGTAFFVRDNGAGFSMEHSKRLFRPFQRLHGELEYPGTGIGLATVYRVIDRHGGRVWAEASEGRGATFYFTLPPERRVAARARRR
jgi:two-component system, NtrC family, sensor kinase